MDNLEKCLIAGLIPLLFFLLLQFTKNPRKYLQRGFYLLLIEYLILLFYFAVIDRFAMDDYVIQTELLWGYHKPSDVIYKDNIVNIIVFIPVGLLISVISKRLFFLKSIFIGLFISETIECCQLIFKRGNFDVDDLFNNTVGSLIGALFYLILLYSWRFSRKQVS